MQYPNSYKTRDGDYVSCCRTLAIAIVRGSFVTRTTLALLLYTVRMLAGSIILQVALTTLVAFVTQSSIQNALMGNDEMVVRLTDARLLTAACCIVPKSYCALN